MMLYDVLVSSNRLTPEESMMLTPFLPKSVSAAIHSPVKILAELDLETPTLKKEKIKKFQVSKKTAIRFCANISLPAGEPIAQPQL